MIKNIVFTFLLYTPILFPQENNMTLPTQTSEFSFILQPSSLGGVGVFAAHNIPKGAILFTTQFKIRKLQVKDVPAPFIQFCVYLNDEECLGPDQFDRMEIGWYINHSNTPNIIRKSTEYTDEEINSFKARPFTALQDIKAGDEITVDYNYLAEPEHLKEEFYKN